MTADAELREFRAGYYALLAELLAHEPSADLLGRLAEAAPARSGAAWTVNPALGEGWTALGAYLGDRPPARLAEEAAEEFTRLFVGPGKATVFPYESYYLTGALLDRPLAAVREFLAPLGLRKDPAHPEPEDWLPFELSVVLRLIERERLAADAVEAGRWLDTQATFLKRHLLVWAPACARDLEDAPGARLYRAVGRLLAGFLQVELDLFRDRGPEPLRSLEEARARFRAQPTFRGPVFELPSPRTRPGGSETSAG